MKKIFNKKNVMLILDAIIACALFIFVIFGVLSAFKTVKAEETPRNEIAFRDVVLTLPDDEFPTSEWTERDLVLGEKFGGKWYKFDFADYFENGVTCSIVNSLEQTIILNTFSENYLQISFTNNNRESSFGIECKDDYFYIPDSFNQSYIFKEEANNIAFIPFESTLEWTEKTTISEINGSVKVVEAPVETEVIEYHQKVFNMPDKTNKNNWVEREVQKGESFGGKYYRVKLPTTSDKTQFLNVQFNTNGTLKYESIGYNLDEQQITFSRYGVESSSVVLNGEVYLEFYIPATFSKTVCYPWNLTTTYKDYYDETYVVTMVVSPDIKVITPPETEDAPATDNSPNENEGEETEEFTFIEGIGQVFTQVFNVEVSGNKTLAFIGWTFVAMFIAIAIIIVWLFIK